MAWLSPFLRSISGKKSRSTSNYELPEDTSSGKVYFTRCCFSSEQAARKKGHQAFEINPWQIYLSAILNFMVHAKSVEKIIAEQVRRNRRSTNLAF